MRGFARSYRHEMNMTPELWQRLKPLFHAAREETKQDRAAFIEAACGDDLELKMHLKRLLDADEQSADSRDAPLAHLNHFLDDNGVPLEAGKLAVGEVGIRSDGHDALAAHVTSTYSIPVRQG